MAINFVPGRNPWDFDARASVLATFGLPVPAEDVAALLKELRRTQRIEAAMRRAIDTGATADWVAVHKVLDIP